MFCDSALLIDVIYVLIKFVNSAESIYAEFTENNNVMALAKSEVLMAHLFYCCREVQIIFRLAVKRIPVEFFE